MRSFLSSPNRRALLLLGMVFVVFVGTMIIHATTARDMRMEFVRAPLPHTATRIAAKEKPVVARQPDTERGFASTALAVAGLLLLVFAVLRAGVERLLLRPVSVASAAAHRASEDRFRVASEASPDTHPVCNSVRGNAGEAGKPLRSAGVRADSTERKQYLGALQRANRAFKTLPAANEALLHASSESELLREVCRVIVDTAGYQMATVGYPRNDQEKTIAPKAWAGVVEGYLTELNLTWADSEQGQRPIGRAIRSGKAEITRGVRDPSACAPAQESVPGPRGDSNLALPLLDGNKVIGAMSIYAADGDAFDDAEVLLLQELADRVARGITILRLREQRDCAPRPMLAQPG